MMPRRQMSLRQLMRCGHVRHRVHDVTESRAQSHASHVQSNGADGFFAKSTPYRRSLLNSTIFARLCS